MGRLLAYAGHTDWKKRFIFLFGRGGFSLSWWMWTRKHVVTVAQDMMTQSYLDNERSQPADKANTKKRTKLGKCREVVSEPWLSHAWSPFYFKTPHYRRWRISLLFMPVWVRLSISWCLRVLNYEYDNKNNSSSHFLSITLCQVHSLQFLISLSVLNKLMKQIKLLFFFVRGKWRCPRSYGIVSGRNKIFQSSEPALLTIMMVLLICTAERYNRKRK